MVFKNRKEAGRLLAQRLTLEKINRPIVFALPRGGVPIGNEVARALSAPLEILVVRKIGSPENSEYGLGAVTEGGYHWINTAGAEREGVKPRELDQVLSLEKREVERRVAQYRGNRPVAHVLGRTALVVDDGLATGVTARVGCQYLKRIGAKRVILSSPVGSREAARFLRQEVDQVICLEESDHFFSVGGFYDDFHPLSDEEVISLLPSKRSA